MRTNLGVETLLYVLNNHHTITLLFVDSIILLGVLLNHVHILNVESNVPSVFSLAILFEDVVQYKLKEPTIITFQLLSTTIPFMAQLIFVQTLNVLSKLQSLFNRAMYRELLPLYVTKTHVI